VCGETLGAFGEHLEAMPMCIAHDAENALDEFFSQTAVA
jgi:hypothetical protein